jgi:hypothetical protein
MSAVLKGKNPACNECAHEVISRKLIVLLELPNKLDNAVCFLMAIPRVQLLVSSSGITGNISRQVDKVRGTGVLHIKESLLPFPARFKAGEFVIRALMAGRDYARPALNNGFGERYLQILDRVDPEVVKSGKASMVGERPT